MSMDHLIGQRFALTSKMNIRYVGTLHQINPEQQTIALEDVVSLGSEDRPVEHFVAPSNHRFEYIVFKGTDVKDIKALEEETAKPENQQPPNDPAILNSSRPAQPPPAPQERRESPYPPPGYPQQGYPPYGPPQFGRGYGPPPPGAFGPGPGFSPYGPPPPGYFGPPGQGFPPPQFQGPPPPPIDRPAQQVPPPSTQAQQPKPAQPTPSTQELPVDNKDAPSQPSASKPSKAPQAQAAAPSPAPAAIPTGPKTTTKGKVAPAMPFTVNQKSFTPPVQTAPSQAAPKQGPSKAEMDEAAQRAREAVQAAMANVPGKAQPKSAPVPVPNPASHGTSVEALTRNVASLTTSTNGAPRGRGAQRGPRGDYTRGRGGPQAGRKIEIPKSDYDFETANKKFNKEDLIKEAIASGSPVAEDGPVDSPDGADEGPERKNSLGASKAYNKSSSFFDNISSEAKDREDNPDPRSYARQQRQEEFKRNVDTFGQGNVDGGYRGRGRGGYRGRTYGGNRGYRGGYRGTGGRGGARGGADGSTGVPAPPTTLPTVLS
ncbi:uncharacterized protein AB675_10063 [Cyphellophora attinorum]|uniref:Protein sum2 n=1 Tax=Cyphellophora attinorum TaxID=1664694 RepID=A0A0N0NJJ2_9EURO|nr:uncharacterized protein AB675_10063 [Phialophora attinorum]KPI36709.1 hypothetical protein AB675_10063 [Phialophora attinorum]